MVCEATDALASFSTRSWVAALVELIRLAADGRIGMVRKACPDFHDTAVYNNVKNTTRLRITEAMFKPIVVLAGKPHRCFPRLIYSLFLDS